MTLIAFAICIVVVSLLCIVYFLHGFYVGTAAEQPGTEIRPMGLAAVLVLSEMISILIGGVFAISGFVVSLKQRRWWLAVVALMTGALTWVPSIVSHRGFDYVVNLRHLILEE